MLFGAWIKPRSALPYNGPRQQGWVMNPNAQLGASCNMPCVLPEKTRRWSCPNYQPVQYSHEKGLSRPWVAVISRPAHPFPAPADVLKRPRTLKHEDRWQTPRTKQGTVNHVQALLAIFRPYLQYSGLTCNIQAFLVIFRPYLQYSGLPCNIQALLAIFRLYLHVSLAILGSSMGHICWRACVSCSYRPEPLRPYTYTRCKSMHCKKPRCC